MGILDIWHNTTDWLFRKKAPDEFPHQDLPEYSVWRGKMKSWEDEAYNISREAYCTILRNDVVMQPMLKFAERMSGMQLTVVGSGKRRDELQKIVDRTSGIGDMLHWLSFAKIEGARFISHRAAPPTRDDDYWVPDFRGCGARKWKAGGNIYWEGWRADLDTPEKSLGKVEETPPIAGSDPEVKKDSVGQWYDRQTWTVFRPGAGTNPEGEVDIVRQLFLLSESAQLLDKAMRVYADRYSLPRELLKEMIDKLRPDELVGRMRTGVDKMVRSDARRRMAMPADTMIELLEPKGNTWEFLTNYRTLLERRAVKLIWGDDLTAASTEGGDRGGKELGDKQSYAQLVSFGQKIADALSNDWLPWIEKLNDDKLPKLKKSEPKPFIALRPPAEKQRLSVAELVQAADRRIPMRADDVYAILGLDRPPDVDDVFEWDGIDPQQAGGMPSNTGESTQRPDREQDGSNMPADKPQDENEDLRNLPKE